eukprot:Trichotokara_eunicae@DN3100_c0_g1_i1.p1
MTLDLAPKNEQSISILHIENPTRELKEKPTKTFRKQIKEAEKDPKCAFQQGVASVYLKRYKSISELSVSLYLSERQASLKTLKFFNFKDNESFTNSFRPIFKTVASREAILNSASDAIIKALKEKPEDKGEENDKEKEKEKEEEEEKEEEKGEEYENK